jgi:hypothetical protein
VSISASLSFAFGFRLAAGDAMRDQPNQPILLAGLSGTLSAQNKHGEIKPPLNSIALGLEGRVLVSLRQDVNFDMYYDNHDA